MVDGIQSVGDVGGEDNMQSMQTNSRPEVVFWSVQVVKTLWYW